MVIDIQDRSSGLKQWNVFLFVRKIKILNACRDRNQAWADACSHAPITIAGICAASSCPTYWPDAGIWLQRSCIGVDQNASRPAMQQSPHSGRRIKKRDSQKSRFRLPAAYTWIRPHRARSDTPRLYRPNHNNHPGAWTDIAGVRLRRNRTGLPWQFQS